MILTLITPLNGLVNFWEKNLRGLAYSCLFVNSHLQNLTGENGLTHLRFCLPSVDWRFDLKYCHNTWSFFFLWTKNAHTWLYCCSITNMSYLLGFTFKGLFYLVVYYHNSASLLSIYVDTVFYLRSFFQSSKGLFLCYYVRLGNYLILWPVLNLGYYILLVRTLFTSSGNLASSTTSNGVGGSVPSGEPKKPSKNDRKPNTANNAKKVAGYKTEEMSEKDEGQVTDNPHIIAKRQFNSDEPVTLETLNHILASSGVSVTQEELDYLTSITPEVLSLPLPSNDPLVMSIIGTANTRESSKPLRKSGVYIFTNLQNGSQYVGSAINLARRVRHYATSRGLLETRKVSNALAKYGFSSFSLSVYNVDLTPNEANTATLILALEQYLILTLKPSLNTMLVAGGSPSLLLDEPGRINLPKQGTAIYVYNSDNSELLYTCNSAREFADSVNISLNSIFRCLKGQLLYNTYSFSRELFPTATPMVMSAEELRLSIAELHKGRMKLRDHSAKVTSNMSTVTLTDLLDPLRKVTKFVSRNQAYAYTSSLSRPVSQKKMSQSTRFEHNGWLVETGGE